MRVLIDTNDLISAVLSVNGIPFQAYLTLPPAFRQEGVSIYPLLRSACPWAGTIFCSCSVMAMWKQLPQLSR